MSTKILIVDEAESVRAFFSDILRSLDCVTVEASNGGDGLRMLEDDDFDAAIFDVDARQLGGIELLQVVRSSNRYSMLPVMLITDGADQNTVREAIRHGASECLTRPFDARRVRSRLEGLIKIAPRSSRASAAAPSSGPGTMPSALIVDRNAELRHFIASVLTSTYSTTQAEDGLKALRICGLRPQSVLVVGDHIGNMGPHVLARRLKRIPSLADMRVMLMTRKAAADIVDPKAFDAILTQTFVAAEFTEQFQQALDGSAAGAGLDDVCESVVNDVRENVVSATEQVLGMMASAAVALLDERSPSLPPPELEASTVMSLPTRGAVRLALRCDLRTAGRLGAEMTGLEESEIAGDELESGLREMVNVIGGRVKAAVTRAGQSASYTIPESSAIDPSSPQPATDVTLQFASRDQKVALRVLLAAVDADAPAADGASSR
jgi:CheY-like chemotaxis protein